MSKKLYGVYDNGVLIYSGTSSQIAKEYKLKQSSMYTYTHSNAKLKSMYDVRVLNEIYEEKPKNRYEKTLDYLVRHLLEYGNTVINKHPEIYINDLKKMGIKVKVRKVVSYGDDYLVKRKDTYYILEVI